MKSDIQSKHDIEILVEQFYQKIKADDLLGPVFTDIVKVNWEKHLPVMISFWENALFYNGSYAGNPIQTHRHLHNMFPLNEEYFTRWLTLFIKTVDELFEGEKSLLVKQKAFSIASVMKVKVLNNGVYGME
jgi:hemoglobin